MLLYQFFSIWNLAFLVSIILLFSRTSRLTDKIKKLEDQISGLGSTNIPKPQNVPTPNFSPDMRPIENLSLSELSMKQPAPTLRVRQVSVESDPISDWFKQNLLLKIGILMILVGFGWFVSLAFMHNWIGPVGRITLGVVLGAIVTLVGTFRLGKERIQGNALTILGTALIVITILAGQYYYGFFNPTLILALVFAISLYVSMTAVGYNEEKLAIYGMTMSLLAPYLSHTSGMSFVLLYAYLAVTSVAGIWISIVKNWRNIMSVGITGLFIYGMSSIFGGQISHYELKYVVLFTVYLISIIYIVVSNWSMVSRDSNVNTEDSYTTIVNSIIMLGFTVYVVPTVYQSLTIAVWMLVYAISGFFVFSKTKNLQQFYINSCIAVALLAIATSIELSGQTLAIAFAFESAIVIVSAFIVTGSIDTSKRASVVMLVPIVMSFQSINSYSWSKGIIHSDFFLLALLMILLGLLGLFYKSNSAQTDHDSVSAHEVFFVGSSFYLYALVWLCSHSLLTNKDSAVFLSLFVYTISGLSTHFYGLFNHNNGLRKYGMALLIMVVARLVFVDVWNMELALRVVTFVVLGVMFMSTAFISRNQNLTNKIS